MFTNYSGLSAFTWLLIVNVDRKLSIYKITFVTVYITFFQG